MGLEYLPMDLDSMVRFYFKAVFKKNVTLTDYFIDIQKGRIVFEFIGDQESPGGEYAREGKRPGRKAESVSHGSKQGGEIRRDQKSGTDSETHEGYSTDEKPAPRSETEG